MEKKIGRNPIIGFFFAIFIVGISLIALFYATTFSPRARLLPLIVSGILIVLGSIEAWHCWREEKEYKEQNQVKDLPEEKLSRNKYVFTIGFMALYPILLNLLGFVLASILEMAVLMKIRGIQSLKKIVIITLVTPFIIYLLFNILAGINLPKGPLGF